METVEAVFDADLFPADVCVCVCVLPWQESDKCFECNSQHHYKPGYQRNSHRIENVIYLMDSNGDETWWQSANGRSASASS